MTSRDYEHPDGREISISRSKHKWEFGGWAQPTVVERGTARHQLYSQVITPLCIQSQTSQLTEQLIQN